MFENPINSKRHIFTLQVESITCVFEDVPFVA